MRLSTLCLRVAVLFALFGILMGLAMGATKTFTLSTVHAHMNLLGWVTLFLYGLFYRGAPEAEAWMMARWQFAASVAGVCVFLPSLALELTGPAGLIGLAGTGLGLGSVLIFTGMLLFAGVVFRQTGANAR